VISNLKKKIIDVAINYLPPSLYLKYREIRKKAYEPEFELLPFLCDSNKISIDIGANLGSYTSKMIKFSKKCWAFEPIPQLANFLERAFSPTVNVRQIALSSTNEETVLEIPNGIFALASIEENNVPEKVNEIEKIKVECRTLDSFHIENVGFIKIDVEGHELDVLKGSKIILSNDHPNLLIEAEERHKKDAVQKLKIFLDDYGYEGFFLINEKLQKIENFKKDLHQNTYEQEKLRKKILKGKYINNFIFLYNQDIKNFSKFFV